MNSLLIIFAKEPVPGQVKTRLCPPLSLQAAAHLYNCFLEDILEEMGRLPDLSLALGYSPPASRSWFRARLPESVELFPQEGADLGERMARALARGLEAGFELAMLRGSDTPDLPGRVVLEARDVLASRRADVALGPAADGGYYLVGLRKPRPDLFRGLAWSGPLVLEETLDRARRLSLSVHLLPEWHDIDDFGGLRGFLDRPHPAPEPGWRSHRLARRLLAGD